MKALPLFMDPYNLCILTIRRQKILQISPPSWAGRRMAGEMFPNWLFLVCWGWKGKKECWGSWEAWSTQVMFDLWAEGLHYYLISLLRSLFSLLNLMVRVLQFVLHQHFIFTCASLKSPVMCLNQEVVGYSGWTMDARHRLWELETWSPTS